MSARDRLVRADDSVLVVVDVQREFLAKLPPGDAERVVERIRWLVGVAGLVGVPVVVTEEEPRAQRSDGGPHRRASPRGRAAPGEAGLRPGRLPRGHG